MALNWGSVADWVSGLGTLAAVVTALHLASDAQRLKLDGYCGLRLIVGMGEVPRKQFLMISVTNIGNRTATINNIGMRVGRLKKRYAVIPIIKDAYSDGIPVSINDGEVARWGIPLNEDKKWLKELTDGFVNSKLDAKSLRFFVNPTHGATKILKPEPGLVNEIISVLKDQT